MTRILSNLSKTDPGRTGLYVLSGLGAFMLAGYLAIVFVSFGFEYAQWDITAQTLAYIGLAMALGIGCSLLIWLVPRLKAGRAVLGAIFIVGLCARLMMFASNPVLEDDWHRYLWDGASVANAVDPYAYAPAEATPVTRLGEQLDWSDDPKLARLQELTEEDFLVYARINYPYFKTIYPPIAQAGFGFAHLLAPYSLNGWRAVLLAVDLLSFVLILWGLKAYGRSGLWVGLYWWNPVIVLEMFNAGHMDGLIVPFLVGTLLLVRLGRLRLALVALAGAAAVKLWPVLLAPAVVRRAMFKPVALIGYAALFCVVAGMLLWPQLRHVVGFIPGEGIGIIDSDQGLVAYAEGWRRNAFLFTVLSDGLLGWLDDDGALARRIVMIIVALGALLIAWRRGAETDRLPATCLAVIALLIFLSPTGYPWYQIWLAGLIPFAPRLGYLALMTTAPLYYTRFLLGDSDPLYQYLIVPLAFGIPLLMLGLPYLFKAARLRKGAV
ncbi:MAG: hypothetical protein ABJG15_19380 [Hyphomonadaceae bacterium]